MSVLTTEWSKVDDLGPEEVEVEAEVTEKVVVEDKGEGEEESNSRGGNEEEKKEKMSRKLSQASLCSMDNTEEEEENGGGESDEEKEEEEEVKDVLLLGPRVSLKDQLELDKDDESLRRWKEKLLGSVDLSAIGENAAEPEVKILSLSIVSPYRPDVVLSLPFVANNKGYAFALKDGSHYRLMFTFTVSKNIVVGLQYKNTVWKTGVKVDNNKVMLGAFSPRQDPYTFELEEETTPSGYFARGSYSARTKFVDDDGKCYLDTSYYFEIRKEWPTS